MYDVDQEQQEGASRELKKRIARQRMELIAQTALNTAPLLTLALALITR